jgi:hypothetical protein
MVFDARVASLLLIAIVTSTVVSLAQSPSQRARRRTILASVVLATLLIGVGDYWLQPVKESPLALYLVVAVVCPMAVIGAAAAMQDRIGNQSVRVACGVLVWLAAFWGAIRVLLSIDAQL